MTPGQRPTNASKGARQYTFTNVVAKPHPAMTPLDAASGGAARPHYVTIRGPAYAASASLSSGRGSPEARARAMSRPKLKRS